MREAEKYIYALRQIVNMLGPDKFGCTELSCLGCQAEASEALRIAKEALGEQTSQ